MTRLRCNVLIYSLLSFFLWETPILSFAAPVVFDTRTHFQKLISARPWVSPNTSISTPTGYGLGWGTAFFGLAGQLGTTSTTHPFGQYGFGFGLGNPDRYLGLTTVLATGGLDEFNRDGNLNFQLAHNFLGTGSALAVGSQNVSSWSTTANNRISSYIVGSQIVSIQGKNGYFVNVIASLGGGNTRFVRDLGSSAQDSHHFQPFGSIGVQFLPQASFIVEYVGRSLNTGLSIIPFAKLPLVATITGLNLNNGQHIPIAGSLAYVVLF